MPLNQPGRSGGLLPYLFLYIPVVWAALLIAQSLGDGLPELLTNLTAALQTPLKIRWTEHSLMSILACTGLYVMGICLYRTTQGRTRDGEEHGSAQWASPKQVNAMFCQKQNKPLTKHVRLGLDTHKHRRSLNVLVIGGSGAAKTRSYVLPNILEANTNYVITDPKMEVLTATGGYLKSQGYDVRVLNLVNLEQSADAVLGEQRVFSARYHEPILAPQTETEAIPMLDLISLVLHDEEEVTDIVGILYGLPQIRLQHCPEGGLAPALPQPLNVADGLICFSLHDDGQAMFPAQPV